MNPLLANMLARRSTRAFEFKEVTDDQVHDILKAAMAAPSACGADPWDFMVVRTPGQLSRVAECLPRGQHLANASVGIVVCGEKDRAHGADKEYMVMDCSAAMENILLAATFLGLGSCWLGVHPRVEREVAVRNILGIPENITPIGIAAIGYVKGHPHRARTRYDELRVHREIW